MSRYGLGTEKPLWMEQTFLRDAGLHRALRDATSLSRMINPLGVQTHLLQDVWQTRTLIEQFSSPSYMAAIRGGFETPALASAIATERNWMTAFEREHLFGRSERDWASGLTTLGRSWERHLSVFANVAPDFELERPIEVTLRAWSDVVQRAARDRAPRLPERVLATGRGALGVLAAGAILLDDDEEDQDFLDLDDDEEGLLSRDGISNALRQELRRLHPRLPARLDSAWAQVAGHDPSAPSLAAHALMELIDWSLRIGAPDPDVLEWHAAQGRPAEEVASGRPTRNLRARYVLQDRREDQRAARLLIRGLDDIVGQIQKYKHDISSEDTIAVARLIPMVEGILIYLFV